MASLRQRVPASNIEFCNTDMFEGKPYACNIVIRQDAEFKTRSDRTDERFRRYVMAYLARVTFDKNSELLVDLFDTPKWMIAVGRTPAHMGEFFNTDSWWVTLYSSVIGDWRNMDNTEARDAFPEVVVEWVIKQCMGHHFFVHGGLPCPLT